LADETLDGFLAEPDRPAVLDPRWVTLIAIKGVLSASELVGGFPHGQEPIATRAGRPEGEEESDNLGKQHRAILKRQQAGACRVVGQIVEAGSRLHDRYVRSASPPNTTSTQPS